MQLSQIVGQLEEVLEQNGNDLLQVPLDAALELFCAMTRLHHEVILLLRLREQVLEAAHD